MHRVALRTRGTCQQICLVRPTRLTKIELPYSRLAPQEELILAPRITETCRATQRVSRNFNIRAASLATWRQHETALRLNLELATAEKCTILAVSSMSMLFCTVWLDGHFWTVHAMQVQSIRLTGFAATTCASIAAPVILPETQHQSLPHAVIVCSDHTF